MRKTVINIFSNTFARFIPLAAALVLTPYIIKQIGVESYGAWAIIVSFVNISLIFDLGFGLTVEKEVASLDNNHSYGKPSDFLYTFFPYQLLMSMAITSGSILILYFSFQWIKIPKNIYSFFSGSTVLIITLTFLKYWITTCECIIRGLEKHYILVVRNLIYTLGYAVFIIIILPKQNNLFGLLLCDFLASAILLTFFAKYIAKKIGIDFRLLKKIKLPNGLFSFSRNAFTLQICSLFLFNVGKIILGGVASTVEVAYFEIANKIFNVFRIMYDQIARVFLPKAAKSVGQSKILFYMEEGTLLLLSLWGAICLPLIIILHDFIYLWLGNELLSSVPAGIILLISTGFIALSRMALNVFMGIGKLTYYVKTRVIFTALFVITSLILTPLLKSLGLAYSLLLYSIFSEIIITVHSFKILGLNFWAFAKKRLLKLFVAQFISGIVSYQIYVNAEKNYLNILGFFLLYNVIYSLLYYLFIFPTTNKVFIQNKIKIFN